jgi:NNP family nitrate/nitrite transporter-like MFS transporter
VGLVSFLAIFFRDQYALTKVQAGAFATLCALTGSMIRPLGGFLAFALVGLSGAIALFFVGRSWQLTFLGKGG